MKRLILGLALMAFVWAVQAQAVEVSWQQDVNPVSAERVLLIAE